jgi:hypothetical protein
VTGEFGSPAKVADRYAPPQVAMAGDGVAVVVWAERNRVLARLVPPEGELGELQRLGSGEIGERDVAVATDGTIAFRAGTRIGVRRPGGPITTTPGVRLRADDQVLAVGDGGRIAIAGTTQDECGEVACYGRPVFVERRPGAARFGAPRHPPLAGRRPVAFGTRIAYTPAGRRVVTWLEDTHPDAGEEREAAFGRAYAWSGGRPRLLDRGAATVELDGDLALTDGGGWTAHLLEAGRAQRVAAPGGRPSPGYGFPTRTIARSGLRVVVTWEQMPDLAIHVALGTLR